MTAIKDFVKKWMDGHESDTFVKNEHGQVMYSAGACTINLTLFFEELLEDYISEHSALKEPVAWLCENKDGEITTTHLMTEKYREMALKQGYTVTELVKK